MAAGGIKKPSYGAFRLLHMLGTERLANPADAIVTRRPDGTIVVALWNLVEMDQLKSGSPRSQTVRFVGIRPNASVKVWRLDSAHGNTEGAYRKLGSPQYPTRAQVGEINRAAEFGPSETINLSGGTLAFEIPVNGLVVLEVRN